MYQSLAYRAEWNKFLQLIFNDKKRKKFLNQYDKLKDKLKDISNEEQLGSLDKDLPADDVEEQNSFKENLPIYRELIKQGNNLIKFLEVLQQIYYPVLIKWNDIDEHLMSRKLNKQI